MISYAIKLNFIYAVHQNWLSWKAAKGHWRLDTLSMVLSISKVPPISELPLAPANIANIILYSTFGMDTLDFSIVSDEPSLVSCYSYKSWMIQTPTLLPPRRNCYFGISVTCRYQISPITTIQPRNCLASSEKVDENPITFWSYYFCFKTWCISMPCIKG